jgi:peptidoglycan/LPS O-acetylase OafA/YrhL
MQTMQTPSLSSPPVATASPVGAGARASETARFYRYDLDGLRGIAIALVAVFHIWFGRVSGGVDVFLTLSGFFFGGKVLRAALNPAVSLSPAAEVSRLVRRLLPALVVVLAACAVLTILVQPETRWEAFADQSLASLGYYQNWELASTASDYLRAGEAVSPLQHIWSMSVQGQFYVGFLLLVAGCACLLRGLARGPEKGRSRYLRTVFVVLLSALTVASFGWAIVAHQDDQAIAYYDSFARAWELLLGALVGALVPLCPVADVAAHRPGRRGAGRNRVLRGPDRRREGIPRPVGIGARGRHRAHDPRRRQPPRPSGWR